MLNINTKAFIEKHLKIKNKIPQIVPLIPNKPQLKMYEAIKHQYEQGKPQRIIVLKARQMGFSTMTEAIIFTGTATSHNTKSGIVAHEEKATTNLFNMTKLYYDNLPALIKPSKVGSNAQEIIFNNKQRTGLNSTIKCMTAGNGSIGRSDTFQMLHISEYGYWPGNKKETLTGLLQAVPNTKDTLVVIESTANGYDDFKDLWDDAVEGKSDYIAVFCAWWELDEYRMSADGIELTQEEIDLKKTYNLDNEQIAWRRWCIRNNCRGDINKFKQEYPSNPEEAFLSSGECVFDKEKVIAQIERVRNLQPIKKGYFEYRKVATDIKGSDGKVVDQKWTITDINFKEDENGYIVLHELPQCKRNNDGVITAKAPYVIGGDISGLGTDANTAKVINNLNKKTAATLRKERMDEDLYAEQLYCLGKFYNDALIGIETNYSRQSTRVLERYEYPNIYIRERVDTIMNIVEKVLGFETTSKTRPIIIAELTELIREDATIEVDVATLKEMLVFVKKDNGRKEAQEGEHDDLVMALAIAHFISRQQGCLWIEVKPEEDNFIEENFHTQKQETNYMNWDD